MYLPSEEIIVNKNDAVMLHLASHFPEGERVCQKDVDQISELSEIAGQAS